MTKSDINILYLDLNKLLDDICNFLSVSLQNGELIGNAKHKASVLIERSKEQLKAISKVSSIISDNDSNQYVVMNQAIPETTDEQPQYSPIYDEHEEDMEIIQPSQIPTEITICPYENKSASEASVDKYGCLEKKEKFLLIDYHKKVFAAIFETWLLLYTSDKDQKVFESYHLALYEAKALNTQKEKSFELTPLSKSGETKSIYFTALTKKDMLQWVSAINRTRSEAIILTPFVPTSLPRMPKDVLPMKPPVLPPEPESPQSDETEGIYEVCKPPPSPIRKKSILSEPPSPSKLIPVLPPRVPGIQPKINLKDRPVPSVPSLDVSNSEGSIDDPEDEYDPIENNSFSSVEEDFYDIVASKEPEKPPKSTIAKPPPPTDEEDDVEYDFIQNVPLSPLEVDNKTNKHVPQEVPQEKPPEMHNDGPEKLELKPKPPVKAKFWKEKAKLNNQPPFPLRNHQENEDQVLNRQNSGKVNSFVQQFSKRNKN